MSNNYGAVKYACYTANLSMSVVATLSPLLFLTFRSLYGISFSMLGALVLINFCTQLAVDLVFSFYSHKFNISRMVKLTPVLTAAGLLVYGLSAFLPDHAVYYGLVIGTVIFSASGGLAEVLISPVIAALSSENPEREMSKLHSVYAWGVVVIVIMSTLFIMVFGRENWQWLAFFWMLIPIVSCVLFASSVIPPLQTPERAGNVLQLVKNKSFLICFLCIMLGGASECTMSQWSSSYLEQALGIPKLWGDIAGVAMFAVMLGTGRTLYSKYGRNIYKLLVLSAAGAAWCYIIAAVSNIAVVGLAACALTGLCTSMLWPGTLVVAADKFPGAGVAVFALMAAGGDLGASVGPQMVGVITDAALKSNTVCTMAQTFGITVQQMSMKIGLVSATVFPLLAVVLFFINYRAKKKSGSK